MLMYFLFMFILFLCMNLTNYLLTFLILMEYMAISMIFYLLIINSLNSWTTMFYLILTVCEAIIGLSILVSINNNFKYNKTKIMNLIN